MFLSVGTTRKRKCSVPQRRPRRETKAMRMRKTDKPARIQGEKGKEGKENVMSLSVRSVDSARKPSTKGRKRTK